MGDEHRTGEQAFTAISHEACPSVAETLLAVVAAWRPVDHLYLDGQLDQMARALFDAEPDGRERARVARRLPDPRAAPGRHAPSTGCGSTRCSPRGAATRC